MYGVSGIKYLSPNTGLSSTVAASMLFQKLCQLQDLEYSRSNSFNPICPHVLPCSHGKVVLGTYSI